jgi:2-polyprenyl-3-methyl-5-hydroxy-6-metoxy-1,4-benzoquinol methylase
MTRHRPAPRKPDDLETIASRWTPEDDPEDLLLIDKCVRLAKKYVPASARVLEVGCSTGYMTAMLLERWPRLEVCEPARENISRAKKRLGERAQTVTFYNKLAEELSTTATATYDAIFCTHVLEHVDDPVAVLGTLRPLLDQGGLLVVAVPNFEALNRRVGLAMGLISDLYYFQAKDHLVGHQRLYSLDTLRGDLEEAGFSIQAAHGVYLKPLSKAQMAHWKPELIEALMTVGEDLPTHGCDIFAVAGPTARR